MLRPYQKAYLKSLANRIDKRYLLGKAAVDESFLKQIDAALEANELIKVGLLQNAESTPKEVAAELESKLSCDCAQIIGRVIVLYRPSKKHPTIQLPQRKAEK